MAADKQAIEYRRGDSYGKVMTFRDKTTKALIDLTGAALTMTVDTLQEPPDDTTKLFSVTGVVFPDQVNDKGKAMFTPTVSNTATVGNFFYDVEMIGADGSIRTPVSSTFTIRQDITK